MALKQGRSNQRLHIFKDAEMDVQLMRTLSSMSSGGAEIGECLTVVQMTQDGNIDSYAFAWHEVAQRVEKQAELSSQNQHRKSAKLHYLRASSYYRSAMTCLSPKDTRHRDNWAKSRECFEKAGQLFDTPFEKYDIPFEDKILPCYLLRPISTNEKLPTLIVATGGEGTAMEMYFWIGAAGLERHYNILLYEGPGNLSAYYLNKNFTYREDCEAPISKVIDFLSSQSFVDMDKIALIGFSFGGYVAARAAAFEKRIRALIPDSPLRDIHRMFTAIFPNWIFAAIPSWLFDFMIKNLMSKADLSALEVALMVGGIEKLYEFIEQTKLLNLDGLEQNIVCPTLALASEEEGEELINQAKQFYENIASVNKKLYIFSVDEGAGAHCQMNNFTLMSQLVYDWLDDVLV
jgi:pimeloyl-ACP methyl ester carboxylesterase